MKVTIDDLAHSVEASTIADILLYKINPVMDWECEESFFKHLDEVDLDLENEYLILYASLGVGTVEEASHIKKYVTMIDDALFHIYLYPTHTAILKNVSEDWYVQYDGEDKWYIFSA